MPSKIVLSGLTAAGKTTHARLLADTLGWRYLGMSEVFRTITGRDRRDTRDWVPSIDLQRAADQSIDVEADRLMNERVAVEHHVVVDAWFQPWLYRGTDAVRVWLESTAITRAMKASVQCLRGGEAVPHRIVDLIARKDHFSALRAREMRSR